MLFFYLQCSAHAAPIMLALTAFHIIHSFAHTLKFQNDDSVNIVKVSANKYITSWSTHLM